MFAQLFNEITSEISWRHVNGIKASIANVFGNINCVVIVQFGAAS
jgi:hypothetical protein